MDADGSNLTRRTSGGWNEAPNWSPDGEWITFARGDVYLIKAVDDGTSPIRLTNDPGWETHPAWSPDGTRIAFVSDWAAYDFTRDIFTTAPTGSAWTQLTFGFGSGASLIEYYQPAWSPDGQRLAVVTCRQAFEYCSSSTVSVMSADGSGLQQLAATSGFARPTWSPDGRTITFGSGGSLYWVSVDGRAMGVVVANGHSPAWRP
jgi:TolB protein